VKQATYAYHDLDGSDRTVDLAPFVAQDPYPLPNTFARENYCGDDHAAYWLMGLRDYLRVKQAFERYYAGPGSALRALDLGCATGRVVRQFLCHEPMIEAWGCDMDSFNVRWGLKHLGPSLHLFQNSALPHLPIKDSFFDVVSAFSVFTHINTFEDTWLLELRRVLKPGGIAYVTFHSERTWARTATLPLQLQAMQKCQDATPEWRITKELFEAPMPEERIVFQWAKTGAYRCNTFYTSEAIRTRWSRHLEVCGIYRGGKADYQDTIVLRAPLSD
jgi:SAM-dependent methyltransferase